MTTPIKANQMSCFFFHNFWEF